MRVFRAEPEPGKVNVSGKALAAGKIKANLHSALPLTINLRLSSQPQDSL